MLSTDWTGEGNRVANPQEIRVMIEEALVPATGSLREIAEEMGVSHNTLWSWASGRRTPTPENLAKLAAALERRGGELTQLARRLREVGPARPDKVAGDDALGG